MSAPDNALHAAVQLGGPDWGHAILGCDWGTRVATPDDREVCTRQARQIFVLHGKTAYEVKVCEAHRDRLYAETDPHAAVPP